MAATPNPAADSELRAAFIAGLLDLACFLEAHPELPVQRYGQEITLHTGHELLHDGTWDGELGALKAFAAAAGAELSDHGGHYYASRSFGPDHLPGLRHLPGRPRAAPGRIELLRVRAAGRRGRVMSAHGNAHWLLPDDGIIDPVAVEITAAGTRRVRLTVPERRATAALILARGGGVNDIAARLHISGGAAAALAASIRAATADVGQVA